MWYLDFLTLFFSRSKRSIQTSMFSNVKSLESDVQCSHSVFILINGNAILLYPNPNREDESFAMLMCCILLQPLVKDLTST